MQACVCMYVYMSVSAYVCEYVCNMQCMHACSRALICPVLSHALICQCCAFSPRTEICIACKAIYLPLKKSYTKQFRQPAFLVASFSSFIVYEVWACNSSQARCNLCNSIYSVADKP
jgi:hypothetical protein